jgi:predicted regulator of Ras-like GTPase activity (Roadblock/LC7/MglB family)
LPNADSVGFVDAAQAIGELMELSSQITAAIALGEDGSVLASSTDDQAAVASMSSSTLDLVSAAADLGPDGGEVTRVEVELVEGAFFVVREGDRTVSATTGPKPTSGLVVYDLRTCAQAIDSAPKKKRASRKPKEESE